MKKAVSFIALCMSPLAMYANMNGSHASLDRAIILIFTGFVLLVANFFLTLGNSFWKKKALSVINSILTLPLVALCAYCFTFNISAALCILAIAALQFFMIKTSITYNRRMNSELLLSILLEAPLSGEAYEEKRGQCGMWIVGLFALIILVVFLINFVLTICNKYWKKSGLRIVNTIVSIPLALLGICLLGSEIVTALMFTAIAGFQFYMIYKSLPV